ncbi:unnamed protein product [Ilex paraguariensis]|uniref:Uncharacterized protein n=1 Tax=Ilex paraguariensis TaxID=185542 RepID=A0ABC8TKW7_9AQUA
MKVERKRTIQLFCPSLSKIVPIVAWEEQRLDIGSISRTFGLDPATLKLNGHFISRGVDLIASSVTWKSLLSFFSARGLSTGGTDFDPLVVDGKLSKVGTKRAHDPATDVENGIPSTSEHENTSINTRQQFEDANLLKKTRISYTNSGFDDSISRKRKQWLEDEDDNPLKRTRINGTNLGFQGSESGLSGTISNTQSPCSFITKNTKRMREDEMVATALFKKIR